MQRRTLARHLLLYAACFAAYFAVRQLTPVIYPYKMFYSDAPGERLSIVMRGFIEAVTYTAGERFDYLVAYFVLINLACLLTLRRLPGAWIVAFNAALGLYFGIMMDGNLSTAIHARIGDVLYVNHQTRIVEPFWSLVPFFLKVVIPLLTAFLLAKAVAALSRRPELRAEPA